MTGKIRRVAAGLVLICSVILYWMPPTESLSGELMRACALVVFAIGFWATGVLPEYLTALIFILMAMISEVAPAAVVFSGFHSTALWLVFGGLVLAVVVKRTGLGQRLAHWLLGFLGTSYVGVISGIVLVAMFVAFFMPSTTGRVVLLVPVVLAMAERLGFPEGSLGRNGMVMAAILGCFVPSCAVLPANVPNMVLAGASESLYDLTFSYGNYLKLHYPVLGFMKGLTIVILTCFLFPDRIRAAPSARHRTPEPLSAHERVLALILSATLLLWGTDFLHGISPAWVALGAALVCMLPFIGLLPVGAFSREINFGPMFYVGGVLGVGAVVAKTGIGDILGRELLDLFGFEPGHDMRNFFSLVILSTAMSPVTTTVGVPAVLAPLSADIAAATGFPLVTVLMTQVIGFSNLILPYQVPPVVVGMQLGGVSTTQGARLTLALAAVSILILMPINYLWWCLLGIFGHAPIVSP
jgi:anion transporter